jgi:hypothetical protein
MSPTSKKEYLAAILQRYQKACRKEKTRILDELCAVCHYNRKYAIRILQNLLNPKPPKTRRHPGRKSPYRAPEFLQVLKKIWETANLPCGKRLKTILPLWILPYQIEFGTLPEEILKKLSVISAATIDRVLKPTRHLYRGKGRSATKPGLLLKYHIPIKTNQWNEKKPGFLEADTVHHCGTSLAGIYAITLNTTDIATGWSEQRATYGLGQYEIFLQLKDIENSLPFPLFGLDCDNGSEFMNKNMYRYLTHRKAPVQFTRSRPYYKNDNAHVEGKNWTHVRQWLGYRRFEHPDIVRALNDLYKNAWRLFHNFFMPSGKIIEKKRIGSKIVKIHDLPKTPYQRILDSTSIPPQTKHSLTKLFKTLNPFRLRRSIDEKIALIHRMARLP